MVDVYTEQLSNSVYGYIYKITNRLNGLVYIGQTYQNVYVRFRQHCKLNRRSNLLSQEINRFGSSHFTVEIVDIAKHKEDLDRKEILWIRECGSFFPKGYNLNQGGKGKIVSAATKHKMREARLGKSLSMKSREKVSKALRERKRVLKTSCKYGHPYDVTNTYLRPDGYRDCKACQADRSKRRKTCASAKPS